MDPIFLPVFGLFVGILIGLTGVGGGAILAPILLIFFKIEIISVVAIDLAFSFITKSIGLIFHTKRKTVDWPISRALWLGSLPSTLLVIIFINRNSIIISEYIMFALCSLILVSGLIMIFRETINKSMHQIHEIIKLREDKSRPLTIFFGSFIGASVAATSVGAGALGTAILSIIYPTKLNSRKLVGTDIVHAIPVSFLAGLTYFAYGNLDLSILGFLLLGSIPGVIVGSSLMFNFPQKILRTIIGLNLVAASIFLLFFQRNV